MFAWQANRVKPKMKSTYTRKRSSLGSRHSTGANSQTSSQIGDTSMASSEVNGVADDAVGDDSMDAVPPSHIKTNILSQDTSTVSEVTIAANNDRDVTPPSHIGSNIQSKDNSILPDVSLAANDDMDVTIPSPIGSTADDSAVVANAANAEIHPETADIDNEISGEEEDPEEDPLYEVEYFMADGYRMVSKSSVPKKALLTKWVGFDKVDELTWEPESEMRKDVPHYVKSYYKTKINAPPSKQTQDATKSSRLQKVVKATRGRPRKDGTAPRGRGRPPKNAQASQKPPSKNGQGRPRKSQV